MAPQHLPSYPNQTEKGNNGDKVGFKLKVKPKLQEILHKHVKTVAQHFLTEISWKKFLISWTVILIASKMGLIGFTNRYFTTRSLVSLEIFHGFWMLAVFCLLLLNSSTIFPNASCLLVVYLPATTVLHILLIPDDYPIHFIILDAVTTLMAILTMFLVLRIDCRKIVKQAETSIPEYSLSAVSNDDLSLTQESSRQNSPSSERHFTFGNIELLAVPQYQVGFQSMETIGDGIKNNLGFDLDIDLEPIDFEHCIDETEFEMNEKDNEFRITDLRGKSRS